MVCNVLDIMTGVKTGMLLIISVSVNLGLNNNYNLVLINLTKIIYSSNNYNSEV